MWDSVDEASRRLEAVIGRTMPLPALLERAFGPTLFIHLHRDNKIAQAVSLVRAQQTGLWHLAADGTVREQGTGFGPLTFDATRLRTARDGLATDDQAWTALFAKHGIQPLHLQYEVLAADPQAGLARVLRALGRDPALAGNVPVATAPLADAISCEWIARLDPGG